MAEVTSINQNPIPSEPNLKDLLDIVKKDIMLSMSCHHIGTIQSFNSVKQTASVTINYKRTFFFIDPNTGKDSSTLIEYPILADCPVICLGGASGALTFPIAKGDECLVIFNDRDLDNWLKGGAGSGVASPRLHSFSDAIVLVGVRSLAHVIQSYDAVRAVLRNGPNGAMVGVGATLIKISNNSATLGGALQELLVEILAILTALGTAAPSGAWAGIATNVGLTATKILGLLE